MTRKHALIAVFVLTILVTLYVAGFFVIYCALGRTVPYPGVAYFAIQKDGGYRLQKLASYRQGVFMRMQWRKVDDLCSVVYRPLGIWDLQRHLVEGPEAERKRFSDALARYGKPVPAGFLFEYSDSFYLTVMHGWSWDEVVTILPATSP